MRWRIYYEGGDTFSDEDGSLKEAPAWGVQAIVCDPDEWHGCDIAGLLDYLARTGIVKFGRLTSNEDYQTVLATARADPDFSPDRHVYERTDYYVWMGAIDDC